MIARSLSPNQLYLDVLDITSSYLGPAAQRFIDRQITSHLDKEPDEITHKDVKKLVDWSRAALVLLTDDKKTINEFEKNMLRLADDETK